MSRIKIMDLEVFYCVGVTDAEREKPQRLLICVDMTFDYTIAAVSDRVTKTIDYFEVSQMLLEYGKNRSWKLIEKLAMNIAQSVLAQYRPEAVTIEVKKFAIPQAKYVSAVWSQKQ